MSSHRVRPPRATALRRPRLIALVTVLLVALLATSGFALSQGVLSGSSDTAAGVGPGATDSDPSESVPAETTTPASPSGSPTPDAPVVPVKRARAQNRQLDKMRAFKERVLVELMDQPLPPLVATFKIGTYNILASNLAPRGVERAGQSAGLITSRGLDVIGLQEVQPDQQGVLSANMPGYDFFPLDAVGGQAYRKPIAWRTSMFDFVDGGAIFYTYVSMSDIPMPWVRLKHKETGAEFYVIDIHQSPGGLEAERDRSAGVATGLIQELRQSGLPVFIVGDMNEHSEFFCRVGGATGMVGANGGSASSSGCQLPPEPLRVDWIMGVGASFSDYVQDGASIESGASDHYFLHANASIEVAQPPLRDQVDW